MIRRSDLAFVLIAIVVAGCTGSTEDNGSKTGKGSDPSGNGNAISGGSDGTTVREGTTGGTFGTEEEKGTCGTDNSYDVCRGQRDYCFPLCEGGVCDCNCDRQGKSTGGLSIAGFAPSGGSGGHDSGLDSGSDASSGETTEIFLMCDSPSECAAKSAGGCFDGRYSVGV